MRRFHESAPFPRTCWRRHSCRSAHHDILCHLKSSAHCTTCAATSSETTSSTVGLDGLLLARRRPRRNPSVVLLAIERISASSDNLRQLSADRETLCVRCDPGLVSGSPVFHFNGNPIPIAWSRVASTFRVRAVRVRRVRGWHPGAVAPGRGTSASTSAGAGSSARTARGPRQGVRCRSRRVWRPTLRTRREADGHRRRRLLRCRAASRSAQAAAAPTEAPVPPAAAGGGGPQGRSSVRQHERDVEDFNPDIAMIGDFIGATGGTALDPIPALSLNEAEAIRRSSIPTRAPILLASPEGVKSRRDSSRSRHCPVVFSPRSATQGTGRQGEHAARACAPVDDEPLMVKNLFGATKGCRTPGCRSRS